MSLRIEVKSSKVLEVNGVSRAGKPFHMVKQAAWAYTYDSFGEVNPFPERIEMNIADGAQPYPVGNYSLDPRSFFIGDFNSLSIGRLVLVPAVTAALRQAA